MDGGVSSRRTTSENYAGKIALLSIWYFVPRSMLAEDIPLLEKQRDHPLTGEYADHRECHLKPDLLLIYKKPDEATLRRVRIGSHSELSYELAIT
jgi:mRNA interferase YafQ